MLLRPARAFFSVLAAASLAACSPPPPPPADAPVTDATADAPADGETPPPMVCRSGAAWPGDAPLFTNAGTSDWGLADVRATGFTPGDLDNDGYPDLIAYLQTPNQRTAFDSAPPVLRVRVLMNRPRPGGAPGRTFVDNTRASNLLALRGGGDGRVVQMVILGDVDNDGDLDAYTGTQPNTMPAMGQPEDTGDRGELMLNDGHGVFSFAPESAIQPPSSEAPQTVGAAFLDQNRDGALDLFVGYHSQTFGLPIGQQPQLFRGMGNGAFDDVTDMVGIALGDTNDSITAVTNRRPLYGVSACDVNGDGVPDLIGASYARQFNLLFVSTPEGGYRDVSVESGMGGDENRDYADNLSYRCYCAATAGACPASVPAPPAGFCPGRGWRPGIDDQPWRLNGNTFSIACGDVDNDGDIDLYTTDIAHPDVGGSSDRAELLVNESSGGKVRFARPGRTATGLVPTMSRTVDEGGIWNGIFDFDLDGRLDIWLGNSDYDSQYGQLFHQNADGRFTEIGGVAGFRHACPSGLALADFDLDGDVDVVVGSSVMRSWCSQRTMGQNLVRLYENQSSEPNWTRIRLVGRGAGGANRAAIGARVRVTAGGVTQTREIQGAYGRGGLNQELVATVGLGASCMIERLEVRWPDAAGTTETFTNVRANYPIEIHQGEQRVRYQTR